MESTIVIKVKYGKTLRRFNACVDESGRLELSFAGLQEKILSLFKLSPEVDLTLTYRDEDGDSVTLVDDEDIHDVMRQSLNPLRITAKVNVENGNTSSTRSSKNSTPIKSSPTKTHSPNFNDAVFGASKAVPDPIREALSKLYLDSKTASSSPQLPELILHFSKLLQNYMMNEAGASVASGVNPKEVTVPNSVNEPIGCEKKMETATPLTLAPERFFINPNTEVKKFGGNLVNAEVGTKPAWENIKAVASSVIGNADKEVKKLGKVYNSVGKGSFTIPSFTFPNQSGDPKRDNYTWGVIRANEAAVPCGYTPFGSRIHPFKRSYSQDGVAGTFHRGVCCDGCGVHPITGPRYKSKVKDNYDLCSICFAELGSEAEYTRLDHPIPYRHPHPCKPLYDFNSRVNTPTFSQSFRGMDQPVQRKLDSRFIADVNVIDGTVMAPLTPFTKIWRMRNNGTLVWPQGTQLVWIGGNKLSDSISAGLPIPVEGLAVENELEVAVNFVAPELPGRYLSYWRLALPGGLKFGQSVWVLIQVDASTKGSALNIDRECLNLNLPPAETEVTSVVPIIVDGRLPIPQPSNRATLVEPLVAPLPTKDQAIHFPTNDNLFVNSLSAPPELGLTPVSYPPIISPAVPCVSPPRPLHGCKCVVPCVLPSRASPPTPLVDESSAQADGEEDDVEEILLKELEEMGFKEVGLNKEILRTNEYNLEKSVDDLCGVCEWDPILEELQEMGFNDNEVNKKLLKKNNGSIKGVVMDLITGEKA